MAAREKKKYGTILYSKFFKIKIQLVKGRLSSRVRRKAIQDSLLLADILNYARSLKITHKAVKTSEDLDYLASPSSNVNAVCYHQENQESQCTSGNQNQNKGNQENNKG